MKIRDDLNKARTFPTSGKSHHSLLRHKRWMRESLHNNFSTADFRKTEIYDCKHLRNHVKRESLQKLPAAVYILHTGMHMLDFSQSQEPNCR